MGKEERKHQKKNWPSGKAFLKFLQRGDMYGLSGRAGEPSASPYASSPAAPSAYHTPMGTPSASTAYHSHHTPTTPYTTWSSGANWYSSGGYHQPGPPPAPTPTSVQQDPFQALQQRMRVVEPLGPNPDVAFASRSEASQRLGQLFQNLTNVSAYTPTLPTDEECE